jgi:hypothetical protein
MLKKSFSILLVTAMALIMLPFEVSALPEGTPISTAADFEAMTSGGTYYLTNDIDLGGKEYDNFIFDEFSGTINGCGYSVFNYTLLDTNAASDVGTIRRANKNGDLVIIDLSFGKEGYPVKMLVTGAVNKSHGVLCGSQENANTMTLTNVTIYADIEVTTPDKCNVGGFIGYSRNFTMTGCKTYGAIKVGSGIDMVDNVYHNAGGFVGSANHDSAKLENCENYAEITTYCSLIEARAAGFIAYTGNSIELVNCINYGDITCADAPTQKSDSQVAGIIAHVNKVTTVATLDRCENFGKITGTHWVSPFIAQLSGAAYLIGCINNGEYSKDADAVGPFVGYENGYIETDSECIDKTDPNPTTTPQETTTDAPGTTTEPVTTTTAAPSEEDTTTATPKTDKSDETTKPDDKKKDKKSCSGLITSPAALVFLCGAACGVFKKKKE